MLATLSAQIGDDPAPATAIDGAQHLCNLVLTNCPGGFPAATLCVTKWCKTGCADPNNSCTSSDPVLVLPIPIRHAQQLRLRLRKPEPRLCRLHLPSANHLNDCESATPGILQHSPTRPERAASAPTSNGSYNGKPRGNDAATTCYAALGEPDESNPDR